MPLYDEKKGDPYGANNLLSQLNGRRKKVAIGLGSLFALYILWSALSNLSTPKVSISYYPLRPGPCLTAYSS